MDRIDRTPPPCSECRALGAFEHEGKLYELFFCLLRLHSLPFPDPDWPTVMARFGDGPDDFVDGMAIAERDPVLGEARRRAIERGLYVPGRPPGPKMMPFVHALANLAIADMEKTAPSD